MTLLSDAIGVEIVLPSLRRLFYRDGVLLFEPNTLQRRYFCLAYVNESTYDRVPPFR